MPVEPGIELFPGKIIEDIKKKGNTLVSPFWVLQKFGMTFNKDSRELALARLLQTNYGNEIRLIETKRGKRIYANDVEPLIKAMDSLYPTIEYDLGPKAFKRFVERIFH